MNFNPELKGFLEIRPGVFAKVPEGQQPRYASDDREAQLQQRIADWLDEKRWPYVRQRMDRATSCQVGVPDFIIAAPAGKTLWIECKVVGNKLSQEQVVWIHRLETSGHNARVVYSFDEFLVIANSVD